MPSIPSAAQEVKEEVRHDKGSNNDTKGKTNINSIIQGLLSDSDEESDTDDFLAQYVAKKNNLVS